MTQQVGHPQSRAAQPQTQGSAKTGTGRRQQKVGRVVSNKMNKTIVVVVESLKKHRIYKRTYKQTKRFQAHDEENTCQIGDMVRIEESRPLSKMKCWRLVEIVKRGSGIVPVEEVLADLMPAPTQEDGASEADESGEAAE